MNPKPTRAALKVLIALVSACFLLELTASADLITWTGQGDGTSWSDPDNWDPRLPAAGDDVEIADVPATTVVLYDRSAGTTSIRTLACDEPFNIDGGRLDIASSAAFEAPLTVQDGILGASDLVVVNGTLTWFSGMMTGAGTTLANHGIVLAEGVKSLDQRTLVNVRDQAILVAAPTRLVGAHGARLINRAGGTFEIRSPISLTGTDATRCAKGRGPTVKPIHTTPRTG